MKNTTRTTSFFEILQIINLEAQKSRISLLFLLPLFILPGAVKSQDNANLADWQEVRIFEDKCHSTFDSTFILGGPGYWRLSNPINRIYGFTGRNTRGILFKVFRQVGEELVVHRKGFSRGISIGFPFQEAGKYYVRFYDPERPVLLEVDLYPRKENGVKVSWNCSL